VLQNKLREVIEDNEKYRNGEDRMAERYKTKYQDYKHKLKQANSSIQQLGAKVARYEMERAAERESDGGAISGGRHYASGENLEQIQELIRQFPNEMERVRQQLGGDFRE